MLVSRHNYCNFTVARTPSKYLLSEVCVVCFDKTSPLSDWIKWLCVLMEHHRCQTEVFAVYDRTTPLSYWCLLSLTEHHRCLTEVFVVCFDRTSPLSDWSVCCVFWQNITEQGRAHHRLYTTPDELKLVTQRFFFRLLRFVSSLIWLDSGIGVVG